MYHFNIYTHKIQRFINWQRENVSCTQQTIVNTIKNREKIIPPLGWWLIRNSLIRTGRRERYKTLLLCFCPTQFLITKIVIEGGGSIWVGEKGARSLPLCRPIWNLNPTSAPHLIEQQSRANTRRIGRRILIRIIIRGVSRLMECATELIMRPRNARHHHSSFYENYR